MAFPLAHPAAVLPLRRNCPRYFDFPALVVGSLAPDIGYLLGPLNVHDFSHRFIGGFIFCLPVGFLSWWLFNSLRPSLVGALPERFRPAGLVASRPPFLVVVVSLLVGIWTHLLWDSLTHKEGWIVLHVAVLRMPVATIAGRKLKVFQLFWYLSSFLGVVLLYLAYEGWRNKRAGVEAQLTTSGSILRAGLVGTLAVMLGAAHHLAHNLAVTCLMSVLMVLLLTGIELKGH